MITPTYTTIKEGSDNKITSKLECMPNSTKWYSVNVTGVGPTSPIESAGTAMQGSLPLPTSPSAPDNNIPDSSLLPDEESDLPDEDSESDEDSDNDDIDDTTFDEDLESDEDSESDGSE
jgi:hypothetical protein